MKIKCLRTLIFLFLLSISYISSAFAAGNSLESQLYEAVQFQDVAKVKDLLAKGVNPNLKESNRAMLGWAAQNGNIEIVNALIGAKADIDAVDGIGHTPLIRAIETQQAETVEALLKAKANPNFKGPEDQSALDFAVKSRKPAIVRALISAGADVKYVSPKGESPALTAAQDGSAESLEIIKILGEAKANLDASNIVYTPLYYAAEQGNAALVNALLDAGANPNGRTQGGQFPIHAALLAAIENEKSEVIEALIKAGADVNTKNASGESPLAVAKYYNSSAMEDLLKKNGAVE